MQDDQRKTFDFTEIFPKDWCKKLEESEFLLRIYTIVPCSLEKLDKVFEGLKACIIDDDIPIWIGGGSIEASNLSSVNMGMIHSNPETGQIMMHSKAESIDLPLSSYLVMGCPLKIDGHDLGENETISRLNRVEALLSVYLGSNIVYKLVFEAFYEAQKGGKYSVVSDVLASIQSCDGPNASPQNWSFFEETAEKINALEDQNKKARIRRALEFYHSGKNTIDIGRDEKFFFYWTAIAVLCEGKGTKEVNLRLQTIYGFSKTQVEEDLLWKKIYLARNDFFYEGKNIHLHKDAERYMQLLFVDLLRHEIELQPIKVALSERDNLDLSVFG